MCGSRCCRACRESGGGGGRGRGGGKLRLRRKELGGGRGLRGQGGWRVVLRYGFAFRGVAVYTHKNEGSGFLNLKIRTEREEAISRSRLHSKWRH